MASTLNNLRLSDENPRLGELHTLASLDHKADIIPLQFLKLLDCETTKSDLVNCSLWFVAAVSSDQRTLVYIQAAWRMQYLVIVLLFVSFVHQPLCVRQNPVGRATL